MGQEQSAPCELRQQTHSHPQHACYSHSHSHSSHSGHSGHSHSQNSGHGYSGHSRGSGAEDGYSQKSKATHYCSNDKSKSQYCTGNSDKSSAKTHYCDKNSNYSPVQQNTNYSPSGTDNCGTGSSKYSRNCSDYNHHPDPGLKHSKGSLSSGCNSSISRTDSNASAESRNPRLPIYKNVHYRDVNNNDIYKPLKIGKNKIHRLKILDADKDTAIYLEKHLSIKSYLDKGDKKINKGPQLPEPEPNKSGIRNYTPKILSEKNIQKDLEHWI